MANKVEKKIRTVRNFWVKGTMDGGRTMREISFGPGTNKSAGMSMEILQRDEGKARVVARINCVSHSNGKLETTIQIAGQTVIQFTER